MEWFCVDTNQLRAFDQIVRDGSFSKAARSLDIAQPTISMRIQALEREIGGTLFARTGSSLELTQFGRVFLHHARQALDSLTRGVDAASGAAAGERGHLTIATLPTLASGFFYELLARFRGAYPQVSIEVHTGYNQEIFDMLYDGMVKVGFMTWPYYNADLRVLKRFKEPLRFVAHHTHPVVLEENLNAERLMQRARPFLRVDWSHEAKWRQRDLCASQNDADLEVPPWTAYHFLKDGVGVALLTEPMVKEDLASGNLVELHVRDVDPFYREIALVCLNRVDRNEPVLRNFIEQVLEDL
jgi:DNA-binding transcriptional LysR family regulator